MDDFSIEPVEPGQLDGIDNPLQSEFWATLKAYSGQDSRRFAFVPKSGGVKTSLSGREVARAPLLLLLRKLPFGFCFGYLPHGPDVLVPAKDRQQFLEIAARQIAESVPKNCVFLRFDLPWKVDQREGRETALTRPFMRSVVDVQVPDTVEIDLTPGLDAVLAGMKSKTRYNIRLSEKKDVAVRKGSVDDLGVWYAMAQETASRDRITLRGKGYYRALFDAASEDKKAEVELFIAEVEGADVAALIATSYGARCMYHYGASRNVHRNYMPTYALQWRAIQSAAERGCSTYDLLGIPPSDDPNHPMHGLYRIKTGFGGRIINRAGCWDFPLLPGAYRGLRAAESVRKSYYSGIRKRLSR